MRGDILALYLILVRNKRKQEGFSDYKLNMNIDETLYKMIQQSDAIFHTYK